MGVTVRVLASPSDEGASGVTPEIVIGDPDDPADVTAFAEGLDVLTIDHENVDHPMLAALEERGISVRPSVETLAYSDKAYQRNAFAGAGIPVPEFIVVDPVADRPGAVRDATGFAVARGSGIVAKASRGGYDGRAVWMLDTGDIAGFMDGYEGAPLVIEPRLELACELAVVVARIASGEVQTWPTVETIQVDGMCDEVVYPAPVGNAVSQRVREVAARVSEFTGSVGVLAVEFFVLSEGTVLVNEIAPRVHNSGHLTIEGSATSQFEQHLRAILDWPLGPTDMRADCVVMANVVGHGDTEPRVRQALTFAEVPDAHLHLYGKTPRDRRKIGHVTVLGNDRAETRACAARASGVAAGGTDHLDGAR